jgi:hypothetical protein
MKTFPKSRVSVLDVYPSFEKGLKLAINFAQNYNIDLNSLDGKKVIMSFCVRSINEDCRKVTSAFPVVYYIDKLLISSKLRKFVTSYFNKIMEVLPFPYCGEHQSNSPDLEYAAANCLQKHKQKNSRKLQKFTAKIKMKI